MAITINQEPTYPNGTYTNLLYSVSSNFVTSSQFQYVMDVVSGSQVLTRIKQYPNPAGSAIFDPSRIMNDYLEYDPYFKDEAWTNDLYPLVQTFEIKFGEEYATSISSSVVLYNGNDVTGSPAVTGTPAEVFPLVIDPNNGSSYNWEASSSLIYLTDRPDGTPVDPQNDYMSFNAYNGGIGTQRLRVDELNASGTQVNFRDIVMSSGQFATINYPQQFMQPETVSFRVSLGGTTIATYPAADTCHWDRVNFVFINNYGVWDSYGVNLPQRKTTNLKRESLTKPFVDYSSFTSAYDVTRRGKELYNVSYEDDYEVVTDWLDEATAEWLTQMIESPEVYVRQGNNPIPIIITNTSYEHNTNRRGQKLFQYTIQYQLANSRRAR